ncbi:MAG TPA: Flp family type IVb pilin [Methylophilaceae bacterium]|nr:Flp family type IVb pilin [Methylophilaceae bacterium]
MNNIKKKLGEFYRDEEGASAIEYALIAAMVAVALVSFIEPINTAVKSMFEGIQKSLTTSNTKPGP